MGKMKFYLLLPMIAILAFGSVSFAQSFDKEALKAEIRAELKAELKQELMAELRSETKADVQAATLGMRDVIKADFRDEIRSEIMQEEVRSTVAECLAGDGCGDILGGLFKGTTVSGFVDTMFSYNLRQHGEATSENNGDIGGLNFIGENDDNSFVLNSFAMWFDKEATDEHPIGWQAHLYFGEIAKRITFIGEGAGRTGGDGDSLWPRYPGIAGDTPLGDIGGDSAAIRSGTDDTARNDIVTIATANITWNAPVFGKKIPITMGKMYTWIGYELVENIGNPNYSHAATYNNGIPFTHMGIKFDVSEFLPSDKWGLSLYYVNGWDSFIDNNESKSYGAYLSYAPNDDFFISLAGIYGNEGWNTRKGATAVAPTDFDPSSRNNGGATMMADVVITYALPQIEKLSLGANFDYGYIEDFVGHAGFGNPDPVDGFVGGVLGYDVPMGPVTGTSGAHWWAAVGYAMYDFTDNQMGAFRAEYFDDTDGARFFGISFWTLTYTHNITIADNLLLRPEVRYNKYNTPDGEEIVHGDKGNTADDEVILTFGAEYVF